MCDVGFKGSVKPEVNALTRTLVVYKDEAWVSGKEV